MKLCEQLEVLPLLVLAAVGGFVSVNAELEPALPSGECGVPDIVVFRSSSGGWLLMRLPVRPPEAARNEGCDGGLSTRFTSAVFLDQFSSAWGSHALTGSQTLLFRYESEALRILLVDFKGSQGVILLVQWLGTFPGPDDEFMT